MMTMTMHPILHLMLDRIFVFFYLTVFLGERERGGLLAWQCSCVYLVYCTVRISFPTPRAHMYWTCEHVLSCMDTCTEVCAYKVTSFKSYFLPIICTQTFVMIIESQAAWSCLSFSPAVTRSSPPHLDFY